jgi:hypothetical protein
MKSAKDEATQRYLLLFKLDAAALMGRMRDHKRDYIEIFAMRRTREHFPAIFRHRYGRASMHELAHCSSETILALDQFYQLADELSWYLYSTEDMPSNLEDYVNRVVKRLEKLHATLDIFLEAEMSLDDAKTVSRSEAPVEDPSEFVLGGKDDND